MFKEKRLIQQIESLGPSHRKRRGFEYFGGDEEYSERLPEKKNRLKKLKEKLLLKQYLKRKEQFEEQQEQIKEKKLLENLEMMNLKCPKCNSDNKQEIKTAKNNKEISYFKCLNCGYIWGEEEIKKNASDT